MKKLIFLLLILPLALLAQDSTDVTGTTVSDLLGLIPSSFWGILATVVIIIEAIIRLVPTTGKPSIITWIAKVLFALHNWANVQKKK